MKLSTGQTLLLFIFSSQSLLAQEESTDTLSQSETEINKAPISVSKTASAEGLCSTSAYPDIPPIIPKNDDYIHISAEEANLSKTSISHFNGNVSVQNNQLRIDADQADYSYQNEVLDARGNVQLTTKGLYMTGTTIHAELKKDKATLTDAFYFTDTHANGKAESIQQINAKQLDLIDASYTTCDPENPDWVLNASKVHLDNESEVGYATHMVMEFKDIPFLYFPYARFPLTDKRLSGFLFPLVGNSNEHGFQFQIPYYWNIAPNYDATITPWYMSERGTMLQTEFRYLHSINTGYIKADYLNDDKRFGDNRERFTWQHQGNPFKNWSSSVNYNYVSDTRYLNDFGNNLNLTSLNYLDQQGSIAYNSSNWSVNLLAQAYQTLTLTSGDPYERLPQLRFASHLPKRDNSLYYDLQGELVKFGNQNPDKVTGTRVDITPSVSMPLRNQAAFLIPKLAWEYTQYNLQPNTSFTENNPSRNLPIASVDSGLFFDRDTSFFGQAYIQTLEPRLFYVYAPYRNQDNLPVFDTQKSTFSINEPFKEDYFDGADRVEDANRLTAMLTTRFLDQSNGNESLMAGIGQIYYFADGRVTLPGAAERTENISNVILQLAIKPNQNWNFTSDAQWDPDREGWDTINANLNYHHPTAFSVDLAYHTQHLQLTTTELRLHWQINPSWRIQGHELYDIKNNRNQESEIGIRYESCCWAISLSGRETFVSEFEDLSQNYYLQVEFKGLASINSII